MVCLSIERSLGAAYNRFDGEVTWKLNDSHEATFFVSGNNHTDDLNERIYPMERRFWWGILRYCILYKWCFVGLQGLAQVPSDLSNHFTFIYRLAIILSFPTEPSDVLRHICFSSDNPCLWLHVLKLVTSDQTHSRPRTPALRAR